MDPVTGLSLGRIALGTAALGSPALAAKLLGVDPVTNPQVGVLGRMFGAREVALGAVTLVSRGAVRRNLVLVGMAVDGADVASAVAEVRAKALPKAAGASLGGVALGAVGAGLVSLLRGRRATK